MDADDTRSLWVALLAALGLSFLALVIAVYLGIALN
jgi:ABC-type phosphate transport system permease subunit